MLPRLLYHVGILLYGFAVWLASPFNPKAKKWMKGRKGWRKDWGKLKEVQQEIVWFHCASLGEFEQGRPLMEKIKEEFPQTFLLVSFFSPSGFENVQHYSLPDKVLYLPLDTPSNMRHLTQIFQPQLVVLVKSELWLNWLQQLLLQNIPLILIAARIEEGSSFFKGPLKGFYQDTLGKFTHIFTQNRDSTLYLSQFFPKNILSTSQDTRFDRVKSSRKNHQPLPDIEGLVEGKFVWICGSSYHKDEEIILGCYEALRKKFDLCLIFAPHNIEPHRIGQWVERFPAQSRKYSEWDGETPCEILWVDHIGMLSRLYHYGDVAFVGGGWNQGLHNILEAATFGCPVYFGPRYEGFPEAKELIELKGAFSYTSKEDLLEHLGSLMADDQRRGAISRINMDYIDQKGGASEQIFQYILQERLLP